MERKGQDPNGQKATTSVIIPLGIAALFFIWGILIFFFVGDKGPPDWDFGVIEDVPGQSAYSTARPGPPLAGEGERKVEPQHVMGPKKGPEDRGEGAEP